MPANRTPPLAPQPAPLPGDAVRSKGAALRRYLSESLFAGAVELVIEHRGIDYRLRQTSLGKLILTK